MAVRGGEPGEPGTTGRVRLALGLGVVATLIWTAFTAAMAGRGFGGGNEGYYLLSYEHWDTNTRAFSMAQYVYGPVFDLVGRNVALLRLFRLATILGVHLLFGWQFTGWLLAVRGAKEVTPARRWAGVAAITAAGGVVYGWLPATPGYNDLTILGAMGLLACFFRLQVRRADGAGPGAIGCAVFGVIVVVMVLAKATMIPCVVVASAAMWLAARPGRDRWLLLGWIALGLGAALLAMHLFVKPLDESVPPVLDTLRVVKGSAHRPTDLARIYLSSVVQAVGLGAIAFAVPGLALVLALRRRPGAPARVAPWIGVALDLTLVGLASGLHGGLSHVGAYQAGIVAMVLTGIAAAAWGKADRRGAASATLVLAMPLLGALGTNNPLMAIAVGGAAMWVAVLVFLASGIPDAGREQRTLVVLATAAAVTICVAVAVTGVTHGPRGQSLLAGGARHVADVPVLDAVRLPAADAARVDRLRAALRPYVEPAGRPMIAFGELSDDVAVLNGRPVGNAWFSAGEDGLQAADLRHACAHGNPWQRQPVVLADRELTDRERAAFGSCGIDLGRDYRQLSLDSVDGDLEALVPRSDVARGVA